MKSNYCFPGTEGTRGVGTAAAGKRVARGNGARVPLLALTLALGVGLAGILFLGNTAREADAQEAAPSLGAAAWGSNDWGQSVVPEAAKSGVTAVTGGEGHSLALKEDGSVVAWGRNDRGQTDVPDAARSGVKAVAANNYRSLALKEDGSVIAWGDNSFGSLTVPEAARSGVKALSGGPAHNLAVKEDGSVVAWGIDFGNNVPGGDNRTAVPDAAKSGVKAVAAGEMHSLAVKEDGSVVAWGRNLHGQTNVPDAAKSGVKAVAAGAFHSIALKEDGSVLAWGGNGNGQTNVPDEAKFDVRSIAAGSFHNLALKGDGSVIAWGGNGYGQEIVPRGAKTGATAIGTGSFHSLAVNPDTTPPDPVGSFSATADPVGKTMKLSWTNPADGDSAFVRILRSSNGFYAYGPEPNADQALVYEGPAESFTDTGLANGTFYKYTAYAYDGKHWSAWNTVGATPYDATRPDTTLADSGPAGVVAATSAAFAFTSTEVGSTFECSLDGAPFDGCTSEKVYENLDDGPHAFEVRATDADRNTDATPASRTWIVDTGPPDTAIFSGPSETANSAAVTFGLSSTERGSTFECRLDGAAFEPCDPQKTYESLGDGFHVLEARAVDAAGTTDPTPVRRTWSVDTAAPGTGITEGPSGTVGSASATFEFLASESGSTFECSLDGAVFAGCSSPEELGGLSDGPHTFRVRARDAASNTDATPASRTWTVDANAPGSPEISSPADGSWDNDGSFVVRGTAERGATVRLFEGATRVGTDEADPESGAWRIVLADVPDGRHTYAARAADAAGNASAASAGVTVVVDSAAPGAPLITGPAADGHDTDGSFTVRGTAEKGARVSLFEGMTLKGTATASAATGAWRIPLTDIADGRHRYTARATDAAANDSVRSAPRTITVDKTGPSVVGMSPTDGTAGVAPGANVVVTFSEAMDRATVDGDTVKLIRGGDAVPAEVILAAGGKRATLDPNIDLVPGADYRVVVGARATDVAGNPLAAANVWRFSVRP